ncbi:hypothetical protein ECH_1049 [Ehrlichia chaffeensis str. Arkansas]|uniref:Uncharacterized protein n=1 Tax=Ehrlichia chaffeensis (strain ATCC CRL-10679 / Arkansas) TaxID=205920 RepID=Q2GFE9_EHRCR|nr:hypothetical protein ECH_1049 [Ehrlichia chaffeensis str. Arkansas]
MWFWYFNVNNSYVLLYIRYGTVLKMSNAFS